MERHISCLGDVGWGEMEQSRMGGINGRVG